LRSRSADSATKNRRADPRKEDLGAPAGSHHALRSQNERDKKGTNGQGDLTTASPGKSIKARRQARPRVSATKEGPTTRGF
jgi:hypothetical protein